MRDKCPICNSSERYSDWSIDFLVPDGWPLPIHNLVCLCKKCGLIYYDNNMTQDDYDKYYQTYYGFDGSIHKNHQFKRLNELIEIIKKDAKQDDLIIDFGGGNRRYIETQLKKNGFTRVFTINPGDSLPNNVDCLVASHVLEHIYDLRGIMDKLVNSISPTGRILIEIPSATDIPFLLEQQPIMDYNEKHINHIAPFVMDNFMASYGFRPNFQEFGSMPFYYGKYYRAVYKRNVGEDIYYSAKHTIEQIVEEKLEKLKQVSGKVIVWGCGDYCMHMLTKVKLDISYYVDLDPAFEDQTIGYISVKNKVISDEPIVIIAQNQQSSILKCIEDSHLTNQVIVI